MIPCKGEAGLKIHTKQALQKKTILIRNWGILICKVQVTFFGSYLETFCQGVNFDTRTFPAFE